MGMRIVIAIWACLAGSSLAAPVPKEKPSDRFVILDTNHGSITIELFPEKAPKSATNFLHHVDTGYYDGTLFHRVFPNYIIQGGGYEKGMKPKESKAAKIPCESDNGLSNVRGTVAVARGQAADSGHTQFYINHKDNTHLDRANFHDKVGYCVFGKVIAGMDVVDAIGKVATEAQGGQNDVPKDEVLIRQASRRAK